MSAHALAGTMLAVAAVLSLQPAAAAQAAGRCRRDPVRPDQERPARRRHRDSSGRQSGQPAGGGHPAERRPADERRHCCPSWRKSGLGRQARSPSGSRERELPAGLPTRPLADDGFARRHVRREPLHPIGRRQGIHLRRRAPARAVLRVPHGSARLRQCFPRRDTLALGAVATSTTPSTRSASSTATSRRTTTSGTGCGSMSQTMCSGGDTTSTRSTGWCRGRSTSQAHPEYFSWMNGKRIKDQLCLSHPDVLKLAIETLAAEIAAQPDREVWSVSQNDNFSYCQCPDCRKAIEEEGSPAGPIIRFVNQVAARFPDKIISTLAYQYSRQAPKLVQAGRQRADHALHDRAEPEPADRGGSVEPPVPPGHRRLGEDQPEHLPLGLHGQLQPPRVAVPEPARAAAEHPVLRAQRRAAALPAVEHRRRARVLGTQAATCWRACSGTRTSTATRW